MTNRTERLRVALSDPDERLRHTYAYDAADQLTWLQRQGYDPLTQTWGDAPVTTFTYDGNGNETTRERGPDFTSLTWTAANYLQEVREREGKGTERRYDGDGRLYWERETDPSGHPDPGAGRTLTHTLDLPSPSMDVQRAEPQGLVPPPFALGQASSLLSPALLPAPKPTLLRGGTHESQGLTAQGLPLEPLVRLPVSWAEIQRPGALSSALSSRGVDAWLVAETPQWTAAGMGAPVAGPPVTAAPPFGTPGGNGPAGSPSWGIAAPVPGRAPQPPTQTSPHLTGLSSELRGLAQVLTTFSDDSAHGGPRTDTGTFVYGDERLAGFSSRKPREERYYGHDALGSNRTVTNEDGRVDGVQSFDPWGVPDPTKHAGNEQGISLLTELFGFAGERQDAWTGHSEQAGQTGQIGALYLRNRWLHPHYARFLSQDPYPGQEEWPLTLHRYAYALDNPTSRTDPGGLFSKLLDALSDEDLKDRTAVQQFRFGAERESVRHLYTGDGAEYLNALSHAGEPEREAFFSYAVEFGLSPRDLYARAKAETAHASAPGEAASGGSGVAGTTDCDQFSFGGVAEECDEGEVVIYISTASVAGTAAPQIPAPDIWTVIRCLFNPGFSILCPPRPGADPGPGPGPQPTATPTGPQPTPTPSGQQPTPTPVQTTVPAPLPCPGTLADQAIAGVKGVDFDYRRVAGPEKHGRDQCHVNVEAGTLLDQHITLDPATGVYESELGLLGSDPYTASVTSATLAANLLASRQNLRGGVGGNIAYYFDWYMSVGQLEARLRHLVFYAT